MTITYALLEALEDIEKKSNGEIAKIVNKAKVTELIKENGVVIGVKFEKDGKIHEAYGVVIITTGGFGADFTENSLLSKYRPDLGHLSTTNGSHCTGDGIKMAQSVGGEVVDLEWVQVHPTGLVHPDDPNAKVKWLAAEALIGVGGILLDPFGNRFCDELRRRDYVTGEMNKLKGPFRLVLNSKASKEIEWHCKHYVGRKLMKRFTSGADLAKEMGITVEHLKDTFDQYNQDAKAGKDKYCKKFFTNAPFSMDDTEFHVSVVVPVVHYCMGGVKISPEAEVMDKNNTIPGLYAAGEVAGGVHGKNRLGGNSLLECVVFGRVAGASASKYLFKLALEEKKFSGLKRIELVRNQLKGVSNNFTLDDIAKHNKEDDCWVTIKDQVYDVSKFLVDHPGGKDAIMLYAGQDCTEQFELMHQDSVLKRYGPALAIGNLVQHKTSNAQPNTVNADRTKNVPELLKLTPSEVQSRTSGGTSHILPRERAKTKWDKEELVNFLNGGKDMTKRRKFVESVINKDSESFHDIYNYSRSDYLSHGVKEFIRIHKPFKDFKPTREDICFMSDIAVGFGALNNSHSYSIRQL